MRLSLSVLWIIINGRKTAGEWHKVDFTCCKRQQSFKAPSRDKGLKHRIIFHLLPRGRNVCTPPPSLPSSLFSVRATEIYYKRARVSYHALFLLPFPAVSLYASRAKTYRDVQYFKRRHSRFRRRPFFPLMRPLGSSPLELRDAPRYSPSGSDCRAAEPRIIARRGRLCDTRDKNRGTPAIKEMRIYYLPRARNTSSP